MQQLCGEDRLLLLISHLDIAKASKVVQNIAWETIINPRRLRP